MQRLSMWVGWFAAAMVAAIPLRPDPIPPPLITVASLFDEILVGLDDQLAEGHWQLAGYHALTEWPRGGPEAKAAGLVEVLRNKRFIPIPPLTPRPVRLTGDDAGRAFFRGVPEAPGFAPRDGSWIGYKYVFYPTALVEGASLPGAAGEPLAFFLVQPAPAHLAQADLAPPMAPALETRLRADRLQAYADYHRARARFRQGHVSDALASLICSAGEGCCQAQFELGQHELKRGTPESLAIARHLFRLAAEQHMPEAEAAYADLRTGAPGEAP